MELFEQEVIVRVAHETLVVAIANAMAAVPRKCRSKSKDVHGKVIHLREVVESAIWSHEPLLLSADFSDVGSTSAQEVIILLADDFDMVWVQVNFVLINFDEFDVQEVVYLAESRTDRASRLFTSVTIVLGVFVLGVKEEGDNVLAIGVVFVTAPSGKVSREWGGAA